MIRTFLNKTDLPSMAALIDHVKEHDLEDHEILELAIGLANSGTIVNFDTFPNADVPSTGGPTSLSTLICPLFLESFGRYVIKLGVPGRPAGGIDVLAQIKGYKINPSENELKTWIDKSNYVHIIADAHFAPLDRDLFEYRIRNNAVNIPSLVIASLLAKKIAVSVDEVGLDIRVSNFGNFGKDWNRAKTNAIRFNSVAKLAGIHSVSILTNNYNPQQGYIGRSEALLAMRNIFEKKLEFGLKEHLDLCYLISQSISGSDNQFQLSIKNIKNSFTKNIEIQGGRIESFYEISDLTQKKHNRFIIAPQGGYLKIDLFKIRTSIVDLQNRFQSSKNPFPDPCGIILLKTNNDLISKGDSLCSVRCKEEFYESFAKQISECFKLVTEKSKPSKLFEIVS